MAAVLAADARIAEVLAADWVAERAAGVLVAERAAVRIAEVLAVERVAEQAAGEHFAARFYIPVRAAGHFEAPHAEQESAAFPGIPVFAGLLNFEQLRCSV